MNRRMLLLFAAIQAVIVLAGLAWLEDLSFHPPEEQAVSAAFMVKGKQICTRRGDAWEPFEIRGVDMGTGIPGHWSTDFAIDKETYLRWFQAIKEMGANTGASTPSTRRAFMRPFMPTTAAMMTRFTSCRGCGWMNTRRTPMSMLLTELSPAPSCGIANRRWT